MLTSVRELSSSYPSTSGGPPLSRTAARPGTTTTAAEAVAAEAEAAETTLSRTTTSTTLVTVYVPLADEQSKHTRAEYATWIRWLVESTHAPLMVFVDSRETVALFQSFRRPNGAAALRLYLLPGPLHSPWDAASSVTGVPCLDRLAADMDDVAGTSLASRWATEQHEGDPERAEQRHSAALYVLWNAKTELLLRAVARNPFQSEFFMWVDAGSVRSADAAAQLQRAGAAWPSAERWEMYDGRRRLVVLTVEPFTLDEKMAGERAAMYRKRNATTPAPDHEAVWARRCLGPSFDTVHRVSAPLFGGSAEVVTRWHSAYYATLRLYEQAQRFCGKDQNLMSTLCVVQPELVRVLVASRRVADPWMAMRDMFYDSYLPSLCLSMIVRNEQHVIERCLRSLLPFLDAYHVVDTGSEDDTVGTIERFMAERGVPGEVSHDPWISDFGYSRQVALTRALDRSRCDYALFVDADERLFEAAPTDVVTPDGIRGVRPVTPAFAQNVKKSLLAVQADVVSYRVEFEPFSYWRPFLVSWSCRPMYAWELPCHERLEVVVPSLRPLLTWRPPKEDDAAVVGQAATAASETGEKPESLTTGELAQLGRWLYERAKQHLMERYVKVVLLRDVVNVPRADGHRGARDKNKYLKDALGLEQYLLRQRIVRPQALATGDEPDPRDASHDDPRVLFYTAQSYEHYGDLEMAKRWYRRRLAAPRSLEDGNERFIAHLQLGKKEPTKAEALVDFSRAIDEDDQRAEGFYYMACTLRLQQAGHRVAALLAQRAYTARPSDTIAFLERDVHSWRAAEEFAVAAITPHYQFYMDTVRMRRAFRTARPQLSRLLLTTGATTLADDNNEKQDMDPLDGFLDSSTLAFVSSASDSTFYNDSDTPNQDDPLGYGVELDDARYVLSRLAETGETDEIRDRALANLVRLFRLKHFWYGMHTSAIEPPRFAMLDDFFTSCDTLEQLARLQTFTALGQGLYQSTKPVRPTTVWHDRLRRLVCGGDSTVVFSLWDRTNFRFYVRTAEAYAAQPPPPMPTDVPLSSRVFHVVVVLSVGSAGGSTSAYSPSWIDAEAGCTTSVRRNRMILYECQPTAAAPRFRHSVRHAYGVGTSPAEGVCTLEFTFAIAWPNGVSGSPYEQRQSIRVASPQNPVPQRGSGENRSSIVPVVSPAPPTSSSSSSSVDPASAAAAPSRGGVADESDSAAALLSSSFSLTPANVFDAVYVINLDRHPQRWQAIQQRIRSLGDACFDMSRVHRFAAYDGRYDPEVRAAYEQWPLRTQWSPGEYGCARSHVGVVKEALRRGYQRILVLEDDACFHRLFASGGLFHERMSAAPADWELLMFGFGCGKRTPLPGTGFVNDPAALWMQLHVPLGAYAYGIGAAAMAFLRDQSFDAVVPYDTAALGLVCRQFPTQVWCAQWPHLIVQTVWESSTSPHNGGWDQLRYFADSGWKPEEYDGVTTSKEEGAAAAAAATAVDGAVAPSAGPILGSPSVVVVLMGGLGNQLFELAAAYTYARQHHRELVLLPYPQIGDRPSYWTTVLSTWIAGALPGVRVASLSSTPSVVAMPVSEQRFGYDPLPAPPSADKHVALTGYFQSSRYFSEQRAAIVASLVPPRGTLATDVSNAYNAIAERVGHHDWLAMHVRRGDYTQLSDKHPPMPLSYYEEALRYFRTEHTVPAHTALVVFSDDMDWCKKHLTAQALGFSVVYATFPDTVTLHMMSRCRLGIVLANSSFSWWAACLSPTARAQPSRVVAPTPWFGPAGPQDTDDLYESGWHRLAWQGGSSSASSAAPLSSVPRAAAAVAVASSIPAPLPPALAPAEWAMPASVDEVAAYLRGALLPSPMGKHDRDRLASDEAWRAAALCVWNELQTVERYVKAPSSPLPSSTTTEAWRGMRTYAWPQYEHVRRLAPLLDVTRCWRSQLSGTLAPSSAALLPAGVWSEWVRHVEAVHEKPFWQAYIRTLRDTQTFAIQSKLRHTVEGVDWMHFPDLVPLIAVPVTTAAYEFGRHFYSDVVPRLERGAITPYPPHVPPPLSASDPSSSSSYKPRSDNTPTWRAYVINVEAHVERRARFDEHLRSDHGCRHPFPSRHQRLVRSGMGPGPEEWTVSLVEYVNAWTGAQVDQYPGLWDAAAYRDGTRCEAEGHGGMSPHGEPSDVAAPGQKGCAASHAFLYAQLAHELQPGTAALILEDDAKLAPCAFPFVTWLINMANRLYPNGAWDLIFLNGQNCNLRRVPDDELAARYRGNWCFTERTGMLASVDPATDGRAYGLYELDVAPFDVEHPTPLRPFHGMTVGYIVSQRGAQRLAANVFPLRYNADDFLSWEVAFGNVFALAAAPACDETGEPRGHVRWVVTNLSRNPSHDVPPAAQQSTLWHAE